MPAHRLDAPVVLFNHNEYGQRLLFKNGIANPRDIIGKNGVTFHNSFSSLFYKTIKFQAPVVSESGEYELREFRINRNSLIKYLGEEEHRNLQDAQLVAKLKQQLWTDGSGEQRQQQIQAGTEGLRHAGRHNQRLVDSWSNRVSDFFKGSFLSWLYQKTIVGVKLINIRFLFVGKEAGILEAGEVLAKKRFHEAYKEVPAYKNHLIRFNGVPTSQTEFRQIPETTKDNYIKYQQHDSDTHLQGKYPSAYKTDTSTGTTGKPTEWVRGEQELETVKKSLQLAARIQFGKRRLSYINAFALGPWATGLTTYELMRDTGSVFATGPDKDKILDKLVSNARYERHQLELAVDAFMLKHPNLTADDQQLIITLIETTLKAMLKKRTSTLTAEFDLAVSQLDGEAQRLIRQYKSEIKTMADTLNKEKNQVIIAGYPPFLKDLTAYAQEKGHNFDEFSVIGVVGGQAISEAMRDQLINHGFNQIYSSYGASDLDINLGVETEYEISVRKAIETNPGLAHELYGENKGLPMVFHYDPMNYHVECDDEDNLLFTCTRNDRSSPRIRYNLGDKGRVYASSDVQALLAKYGMFQQPKTNLPLMFVWGRDSTVVFNGANLAFTELERAVTTDEHLEQIVLKKAFYTYQDEKGADQLEIWLELNDEEELPNEMQHEEYAHSLLNKLVNLNQDFRYQVEQLDEGTPLPLVRFFKRHQSPISEAGGHRKQVLIFQKGVNLPEDYQFPVAECCGYALLKSDNVLQAQVSNLGLVQ
ncbi:phenylacetate--CoA ligase family protein [Legionella lytica]|uniref:Phenylacetate--CoA ligase family protein n=1 Tax=Legionella lytica TaxID=96232 RepID=A0ABW8DAN5_9GAMM